MYYFYNDGVRRFEDNSVTQTLDNESLVILITHEEARGELTLV